MKRSSHRGEVFTVVRQMSGGDGVFHQIKSEIDGHVRCGTGRQIAVLYGRPSKTVGGVLKRRSGRGQAEGELIKF